MILIIILLLCNFNILKEHGIFFHYFRNNILRFNLKKVLKTVKFCPESSHFMIHLKRL